MTRFAPVTALSLCLAVAFGLPLLGCAASPEPEPEPEPFVCVQSDLDAIPTGKKVQFFDLAANKADEAADQDESSASAETTAPAKTEPTADTAEDDKAETPDDKAIRKAIDNLGADCGFVAIDLGTGRGVAYDADEAFYGASTIKAAYCLFLCEKYLDTGEVADTDYAPGFRGIDQPSPHGDKWPSLNCIGNLMECALVNSDNSAYESLRYPYDQAFSKWLEKIDAMPEYDPNRTWYPSFTPTQEAHIWLHMRDYLASGADHAAWLGKTLKQATVSFIKDADLPENAKVQSKAGWDTGWGGGNCVSECALITVDGNTWLFAIMTRQPADSSSFLRATALAQAVIDASIPDLGEDDSEATLTVS